MNHILDYNDIIVYKNKYLDEAVRGQTVAICFSAWASGTQGKNFGEAFFFNKKIPAIFIVQKKNHWWHTSSIWPAVSYIKKILDDKELGSICYGSSMGGYGSIHFAQHFNSHLAIAVGPQFFIDKNVMPEEQRWSTERDKLNLIFNEIDNLSQNTVQLLIFFDNYNTQDSLQVKKSKKLLAIPNINYINCPYTMHDVIRVLTKNNYYRDFLENCFKNKISIPYNIETSFLKIYKQDDKTFINWARTLPSISDLETEEQERAFSLYENLRNLDF